MVVLGVAALGVVGYAAAGIVDGELEGLYVPQSGWAVTQEIPCPDSGANPCRIGSYSMVLFRDGWDSLSLADQERVRKILGLKGPLHGVVDVESLTEDHILGTENGAGVLYTEGNSLLPETGDTSCSEGIPLSGVQTLNFTMGTGIFSGLKEGTIQLRGTINNCPGRAGFLRSDFTLVSEIGGIRFKAPNLVVDHIPDRWRESTASVHRLSSGF